MLFTLLDSTGSVSVMDQDQDQDQFLDSTSSVSVVEVCWCASRVAPELNSRLLNKGNYWPKHVLCSKFDKDERQEPFLPRNSIGNVNPPTELLSCQPDMQ